MKVSDYKHKFSAADENGNKLVVVYNEPEEFMDGEELSDSIKEKFDAAFKAMAAITNDNEEQFVGIFVADAMGDSVGFPMFPIGAFEAIDFIDFPDPRRMPSYEDAVGAQETS